MGRERLNGLEKKVFQCHSCVFCEVRGRNDLGTLWRLIGNIVNRFWMRVAHLGSLLMMWVQVNFGWSATYLRCSGGDALCFSKAMRRHACRVQLGQATLKRSSASKDQFNVNALGLNKRRKVYLMWWRLCSRPSIFSPGIKKQVEAGGAHRILFQKLEKTMRGAFFKSNQANACLQWFQFQKF